MSYELYFKEKAKKEWDKLDNNVRELLKKKLAERLKNPHVPQARLTGMTDCYKIKLRGLGYRLVYQVDDGVMRILVIAVGKRDRNKVYKIAKDRLA